MRANTPDTTLLSRLLRSRLAAGLNPLTGKRKSQGAGLPTPEERSTAVISSLMRDAREAYISAHFPAVSMPSPCAGKIQSEAATQAQMNEAPADPGDLSAFVLDTLNGIDWDEWVTARCDFPESGPFVTAGTSRVLDALAEVLDSIFADACDDGDDLTVSVFTAHEGGSARITVTGPFTVSLDTLTLIKRHRRQFEAISGALYTVRTLGTAGFEALIPSR
jgi:hypothetical protein